MSNIITENEIVTDSLIEKWAAEDVALVARAQLGQQIQASIRKDSKYYGQMRLFQTDPDELFPVLINDNPDYRVQGGPGGQYRLKDVHLYVLFNGQPVPIT
jgi:hypothetical protein